MSPWVVCRCGAIRSEFPRTLAITPSSFSRRAISLARSRGISIPSICGPR